MTKKNLKLTLHKIEVIILKGINKKDHIWFQLGLQWHYRQSDTDNFGGVFHLNMNFN